MPSHKSPSLPTLSLPLPVGHDHGYESIPLETIDRFDDDDGDDNNTGDDSTVDALSRGVAGRSLILYSISIQWLVVGYRQLG
jgi:hypothetical protein